MEIRELTGEAERRRAVPIIQQLWSDSKPHDVVAWAEDEKNRLFGGFVRVELVGVAGVLVTNVLHHAHHALLYDLVVDEARRERDTGPHSWSS